VFNVYINIYLPSFICFYLFILLVYLFIFYLIIIRKLLYIKRGYPNIFEHLIFS